MVLKHAATPTRNKKPKNDTDLGVAPLSRELIPPTPISHAGSSSLPRVTSTITRPVAVTTVHQQWEQTSGNLQHKTDFKLLDKQPQCDFNQNILTHTDQYGNPVQVQAIVDPPGLVAQTEPTFFEKPVEMPSNIQSMDTLHADPMIQRLVEERVAVLESRMRAELQQSTTHGRKSGCYNTAETPHSAPHLRWPNKLYLTGTQRKRTPFDNLSLGQFVVGYINNVLETQHLDMV